MTETVSASRPGGGGGGRLFILEVVRYDLAMDFLLDPELNPGGFYSKDAIGFNIYLVSYVVVIGYMISSVIIAVASSAATPLDLVERPFPPPPYDRLSLAGLSDVL